MIFLASEYICSFLLPMYDLAVLNSWGWDKYNRGSFLCVHVWIVIATHEYNLIYLLRHVNIHF
jgi:hypothetical protein